MRSLKHGTFDTKGGEYEWVQKVVFGWFLFGILILFFDVFFLLKFVRL